MLKLLIADDNQLTRQSLSISDIWRKFGYEVAGEAKDGVEALEKINEIRPDLVLLDIRMPGLNGIEVMEKAAGQNKDFQPIYIMLTAYDDFNYAKKCLQLGAFDYILKPVDDRLLSDSVSRATDKLQKSKQAESQLQELISSKNRYNDALLKNREVLKNKLFGDAINGLSSAGMELQKLVKEEGKYYGYEVMLLVRDRIEEENDSSNRKILEVLEGINTQNVGSADGRLIFCWQRIGLAILMVFERLCVARDYNLTALDKADKLQNNLKNAGIRSCIGISGYSQDFGEIGKHFNEASLAVNGRFFLENKNVIHYNTIKSHSLHGEYELTHGVQEIYDCYRSCPSKLTQKMREFCELVRKDDNYNGTYVKNIYIQIAIMLSCLAEAKFTGSRPARSVAEIISEINRIESLSGVEEWMQDYAASIVDSENQDVSKQVSHVSKLAIDFMNKHYGEHISMADVAAASGVSESHLSRTLKNDTGESFVNLLSKIRIQNAIMLLKNSNYKVYEIAEMVGISNYAYFYQLFKKYTGYSPTDFY